MYALVTLVALLTLVCAYQAAMLVVVGRQLRYHGELLWETERRGVPAKGLPAGATVGPFTVRDTDGGEVDGTGWAEDTLVAFLSPSCVSCRGLRRELRPLAAHRAGGRSRIVVVVTGPDARADFARRLAPVARIVVDREETVRSAFGVTGFPALFVVGPGGQLSWTGLHPGAVPGATEPAR